MAITELRHRVSTLEAGRADRIVQHLTGISRADIRGLFEHGCVSLDGTICSDPGVRVNGDTVVLVSYDRHRRYKERARYQSNRFKIIHEDPYLLVVDKAAGVLTVPSAHHEKDNLVEALKIYLDRTRASPAYPAVVHRLDRDTSGLLVFGKNTSIAQKLKSQFEARKPVREYMAIVAGRLEKAKGTFRSLLAMDEDLNQHSTDDDSKGKLAITHYEVVSFLRNSTHVRVRLETGRRNQIRVHFAEAGHPVLGDRRYNPQLARHPGWKYPRLALHAAKLGFVHPITGKSLGFKSPPGPEFEKFLLQQKDRSISGIT